MGTAEVTGTEAMVMVMADTGTHMVTVIITVMVIIMTGMSEL